MGAGLGGYIVRRLLWAIPVLFQRQNSVGNSIRICRTEETPGVFREDRTRCLVRIPSQCAPHNFVDVVVAPV